MVKWSMVIISGNRYGEYFLDCLYNSTHRNPSDNSKSTVPTYKRDQLQGLLATTQDGEQKKIMVNYFEYDLDELVNYNFKRPSFSLNEILAFYFFIGGDEILEYNISQVLSSLFTKYPKSFMYLLKTDDFEFSLNLSLKEREQNVYIIPFEINSYMISTLVKTDLINKKIITRADEVSRIVKSDVNVSPFY